MDSYEKYAQDVFGVLNQPSGIFQHVQKQDLDEVMVNFSLLITDLEYADNFRIFPLSMEKQFLEKKNRGCCGSFNTQYKCLSGNIYWVGCNYGH